MKKGRDLSEIYTGNIFPEWTALKLGQLSIDKIREQNIKKLTASLSLYTVHSIENNYFLLKAGLAYSPSNENIVYSHTSICIHSTKFYSL